jgi:DNA repair exonuclease SbcCD ATPase subunit
MQKIDDPYIAGFLKAAESNNVSAVFLVKLARKLGDKMSKSNLEKRAGRFAQYVGNKVGRLTSLLFGGSPLRSQNLRAIKDLNKQLAPLKNELGGLKSQVRGLTPEMLNTYNSRIAELNNLIAEAYRTRNPAMSMKQFQRSLNPYINELSELQKRTRGLTESTLLGNNTRIGDLRRQIGDLNRQKADLYDPIRSENKKVLLARTGALGVGTLGAGMYFNSKNEDNKSEDDEW